jgi:hypothetical protein
LSLGDIFTTPYAMDRLAMRDVQPEDLLARHITADWGVLNPENVAENELAVREGFQSLSSYPLCDETGYDEQLDLGHHRGRPSLHDSGLRSRQRPGSW